MKGERLKLNLKSIEIAAGAGGMALGLERAGFEPIALVEVDPYPVCTLKTNRPEWPVIQADVRAFSGLQYKGVDLLAGGIPCPPFSVAGKRLGPKDERDLFPEVLRLAREILPKAIFIENVKGLMHKPFLEYRREITESLEKLGFTVYWKIVNAVDFGLPQHRPRTVLVAIQSELAPFFKWPDPKPTRLTVGELLWEEMASLGWEGAEEWRKKAAGIAPTIVGGSKKHGGPDLGPTRAKQAWLSLGVDGRKIADSPPPPGFRGLPHLTVQMAALLQGFPKNWFFCGPKTAAYRQVGNAFPPMVSEAIGKAIAAALRRETPSETPVVQEPLFAI